MTIAAGLVLGIVALIVGADWLVKGSVGLAQRLRISALVIGLTVVAFGTSVPELAVTLRASQGGSPGIAIGNAIGSNIQNMLLVLGVSSIFVSLKVSRRILWIDMPLLIACSAVLATMSQDGRISRGDGLLLVGALLAYTFLSIRHSRMDASGSNSVKSDASREVSSDPVEPGTHDAGGALAFNALLVLGGLALLTEGGNLLVAAARSLAAWAGISEITVGITVVAFGTSLPEIVTCVLAAIRGHRDLAVGSVIGSNLFNILCVVGVTSTTSAGGLPLSATAIGLDIPLMLAVTVLCYAVCLSGSRVVRGEGLLMLLIFASYVGWLVASNTADGGAPTLFAVSGIGLTLLLVGFQIDALSRQSWLPLPDR